MLSQHATACTSQLSVSSKLKGHKKGHFQINIHVRQIIGLNRLPSGPFTYQWIQI